MPVDVTLNEEELSVFMELKYHASIGDQKGIPRYVDGSGFYVGNRLLKDGDSITINLDPGKRTDNTSEYRIKFRNRGLLGVSI